MNKENVLSAKKLHAHSTYAVKKKFGPFYTGGQVSVSKDGKQLLCSCGDNVQVVSLDSGLVEKVLSHEGVDVTAFAVSPDDKIIITASKALLLKQWLWKDEVKCVRTWKAIHLSSIQCMDFDPSSTVLATGGSDGSIKVWDLVGQYCTHNFRGAHGVINTVKFHCHNLTLYSSADDYTIRVWDLQSSKLISVLSSHVSAVTSLHFPSDNCLVSSGRDGVLCIWNVPELRSTVPSLMQPTKIIPVYENVNDAVILQPNELQKLSEDIVQEDFFIITAGDKGTIRIWGNRSGKCVLSQKVLAETKGIAYNCVNKLPSENKIVAVKSDHCFDFLCLETLCVQKQLVGYNDEILNIKLLGSQENFIAVATNSSDIKIFHIDSMACQILAGHSDIVLSIDVFPDRSHFASSSKDNTIRLWKLDEEAVHAECLAVGSGHTHAVNCVAACNLGSGFMVSGSQDHTLKIWSINNKLTTPVLHVKHTIMAHTKDINTVAIAPNDKLIATGSQDKTAKLWSTYDGKPTGKFEGHKRGIWCVQFSPMDKILASTSADGTVKLWSITNFTCLKTLEGHDCSVLNIVFTVKGTQIISAGSDGLLKLWIIKNSECVQTIEAHDDKIWTLCSNKDNSLLISGSADSMIIVLEDVTENVIAKASKHEENVVLQRQEMLNFMQEKRYGKALYLAIALSQPYTALNIVKDLLWENYGRENLKKYLLQLTIGQKQTLLNFIAAWNTNSHNSFEAQAVLKFLLANTPPNEIEDFPNSQSVIEALLPYTERHYQRLSKTMQQSKFLDYSWHVMKMQSHEDSV
ncbi:transducin beta-like protein 3 [Clavelina lepadiformis]|uniref:transducin beta-like protein 3 n=1 Tax=Clavelina lepadiformis TaxID=159417 RepID=UPI0040436D19